MPEWVVIWSATALWTGLELLAFLFLASAFLPICGVSDIRKRNWMIFGFWMINSLYPNLIPNPLLKIAFSLILWLAFLRFLFRGKWMTSALILVIHFVFSAGLDMLISSGVQMLLNISFEEYVWRKWTYLLVCTVQKVLLLFISWMIWRFHRQKPLRQTQWQYFFLLLLFPIVSGIILTELFYRSRLDADLHTDAVLLSVLLIAANVGIIWLMEAIDKASRQAEEARLLKQQIHMQKENYESLRGAYQLQRKSTHEFQRHMDTLTGMVDQGSYPEAKEYLHRLQSDRSLKVFSIHSNHPVMDVILNQKYQLAQEHGIAMHLQINDLSGVEIPSTDLVVLLSNLLDNAIEACQKLSEKREIDCVILLDQTLFLSVRNTSLPVELSRGQNHAGKDLIPEHGYGIPAVRMVLERLHAEYEFHYEDGWFQFAAEIP